ncbi:multiple sugar transport system permease protein [Orenia metallireducens]|jgi:multiple sugar transport system permease protein|uniref:Multiple sugar transport system permease protein n=1 Tax=Orenia metallireducens TaxID=1413210 RepID=A0A285IDF0_9FIRM|nr:sugar ABC transporter permease [Orenia metallireducens]PRX19652.1 multiple sugar transport system permease protein [Orenia metallireducens]SNY46004.1 multiple sugar transport system permease protein [Orenia metallireducens]
MLRDNKMPYLFLLPTVIVLLLLTVYPLFYAISISFQKVDSFNGIHDFVGFKHYINLVKDINFWVALKNTVVFVLIAVVLETLVGFALALLFNTKIIGRKILRSIILIPMLLPPITVALTWKMMYAYDYGIINNILSHFGIAPVEWLSSAKLALFSIIITDVWQWTPFVFLVLLANLQALPIEIYESAKVDGASALKRLVYITLPLLKPGIILVILLRTIDTFRIFDKIYVLTGGGPGNSTETLTFYIYQHGFKYFDIGFSAATSIVMVVLILVISNSYIRQVL